MAFDTFKKALLGVPKSVRELVYNGTYTPYEILDNEDEEDEFIIGTTFDHGVIIDVEGAVIKSILLADYDISQLNLPSKNSLEKLAN